MESSHHGHANQIIFVVPILLLLLYGLVLWLLACAVRVTHK
jgi:hypothetical protein